MPRLRFTENYAHRGKTGDVVFLAGRAYDVEDATALAAMKAGKAVSEPKQKPTPVFVAVEDATVPAYESPPCTAEAAKPKRSRKRARRSPR